MTSYLPFVKNAVDAHLDGHEVFAVLVTSGYSANIMTDIADTATAFEPVEDGTTVIFGDYTQYGVLQTVTTELVANQVRFHAPGFTITGATLPDVSGVVFYSDSNEALAYDEFVNTISVDGSWTYTVPAEGFLIYVGNPGMWTP